MAATPATTKSDWGINGCTVHDAYSVSSMGRGCEVLAGALLGGSREQRDVLPRRCCLVGGASVLPFLVSMAAIGGLIALALSWSPFSGRQSRVGMMSIASSSCIDSRRICCFSIFPS